MSNDGLLPENTTTKYPYHFCLRQLSQVQDQSLIRLLLIFLRVKKRGKTKGPWPQTWYNSGAHTQMLFFHVQLLQLHMYFALLNIVLFTNSVTFTGANAGFIRQLLLIEIKRLLVGIYVWLEHM
jgi:hypothetical protein